MNDVNDNNSSERQHTIGGGDSGTTSERTALVKAKLSALHELRMTLFSLCNTIQKLSTELQEIADSEDVSNRCLGEESHHLVHRAKKLDRAQRDYSHALFMVKDCVSLRSNDSRMTKMYHSGLVSPVEYGSLIGDCLSRNTHVTELGLQLDTMFEHDYDVAAIQRNLKALLGYIERSSTLRKVNVHCSDISVMASTSEMKVASLLLDAIGKNQCSIDELHWCAYIPCISFRNFMQKTKSLKTLSIGCGHWQRYSRNVKSTVVESLSKNQSVVHLDLRVYNNSWTMTDSVLLTLSRGPSNPPLQHLSLGGTDNDDQQLRHLVPLLQSTTTLQHLEISTFDILVGHMNALVQSLKLHYARPTASITRLSFTSCSFDDEAAAAFIQFMQTPITSSDRTRLQELHMDIRGDDDEDMSEFAGLPLGSAIVSFLTPTVAATNPVQPALHGVDRGGQDTIGSQLRMLSVDPLYCMEGFYEDIKSQACNIKLSSLCLAEFGEGACSDLAEWLPYVQSLTELHLSEVDKDVDPCSMIMALQQSASLRTVTVKGTAEGNGRCRRYLNDSNARRIESICQRNEILFELLSRRTHVSWNHDVLDGLQQQHRTKRQKTALRDSSDGIYCDYITETLLLPSLIQAAKYMPYTRASTILAGLRAFEMELLT